MHFNIGMTAFQWFAHGELRNWLTIPTKKEMSAWVTVMSNGVDVSEATVTGVE